MRYSEYLIWGAVVILLISVISIIVRKDEQRFLQTFFFLGFGAVFLYFVRLTDIDSDFWISDFHDLPLSRMYILCAIIIPLLAAGLTALLSFAVHRCTNPLFPRFTNNCNPAIPPGQILYSREQACFQQNSEVPVWP